MRTCFDIIIFGLGIASCWGLIAVLLKFNLRNYMGFWCLVIVPMSIAIASAVVRLGVSRWLERLLSN